MLDSAGRMWAGAPPQVPIAGVWVQSPATPTQGRHVTVTHEAISPVEDKTRLSDPQNTEETLRILKTRLEKIRNMHPLAYFHSHK